MGAKELKAKIIITPEILQRFRSYHKRHGAWGVFHVMLDDRNLKLLPKPGLTCGVFTDEEQELYDLLEKMSTTQRGRIAKEC